MNIQEIENRLDRVTSCVRERRLGDALAALSALVAEMPAAHIAEPLDKLSEEYAMMLGYARRGMADPDRDRIYAGFLQRAEVLADRVLRAVMLAEVTSYYSCVAKRSEGSAPSCSNDLQDEDAVLECLFDRIYASPPFSHEVYERNAVLLGDGTVPNEQRLVVASALLISLMHVFDARKMMLLADGVFSPCVELRARCLVGLALAAYIHRDRILRLPDLAARLRLICDDASFASALRIVQIQLLLSLGTRRDSKQMSDNIFPEVVKAARKFTDGEGFNIARIHEDADFNPEWTADGKKSPLFEAMQRVVGMQEQGVDMFYHTFEKTMRFQSFFDEASHWFMPFSYGRRAFYGRGDRLRQLSLMFEGKPSGSTERHAIALMLLRMPEQQLDAMAAGMGQFKEMQQAENGDALQLSDASVSADPDEPLRMAIRLYVHDLYRFFSLFRHRRELHNPFCSDLDLSAISAFEGLLRQPLSLVSFGNFCFGRGEWGRATAFFERLPEDGREPEIFEKMGYCHMKQGDYAAAVRYFDYANMLKPESPWTLRQLAFASMQCGRTAQAIEALLELERLRPDEIRNMLMLSDCYLRNGEGDKAMPLLHKAYYLHPDRNTTKALAAGLLQTKRYAEARPLFDKVLADAPDAADCRNTGHAAWLDGDTARAVELYRRAVELSGELRAPADFFGLDGHLLREAGKSETDLMLMRDIVNKND